MSGDASFKIREGNLTLVVLACISLKILNKFRPWLMNLLEKLIEQPNGLVLVHFLMNFTIILIIFGRLEALRVVAGVNSTLLWLILSEIQSFCREHFRSNRLLKVFVRNKPITIHVKVVEALLTLSLWDVHSPKVKEESKFFDADLSCFLDVQVHESFSKSLPLNLHFLKDLLFNVSLEQTLLCSSFVFSLFFFHSFQVQLIMWILNGVMPKEEAFGHVDGRSQPFWKVTIVDFTSPKRIFIFHQFDQVVVVEFTFVSEVLQYIFNCNVTIVILIQHQKRFSNGFKAVREFNFQLLF